MKFIPVHFTYAYNLRFRPNAYPKRSYTGILLIDNDCDFSVMDVQFVLDEGREDEFQIIMDRYSLRIGSVKEELGPVLPGHMLFKAGERVELELSRQEPRPAKFRSYRDGGQGVNVGIVLQGVKYYLDTRTSDPKPGIPPPFNPL